MSKSKGNVVNPWDVSRATGGRGAPLPRCIEPGVGAARFDENAIREIAGRFLITVRNVYNGIFAQYANFGWAPSDQGSGRCRSLAARPLGPGAPRDASEAEVDRHLTNYDATLAARRIMEFFDDDVSKWYVRLSRNRFYDTTGDDNRAAFATLHEVLVVTCRSAGAVRAVHERRGASSVDRRRRCTSPRSHAHRWQGAHGRRGRSKRPCRTFRKLVTLAHAARDTADVKVRQPLPSLQCVVPGDPTGAEALKELLAAELNVKRVEFVTSTDSLVALEAKANFRIMGKKFGKETQQVAAAVTELGPDDLRQLAAGKSVSVTVAGLDRLIDPEDVAIIRRASGAAVVQEDAGYGVALDPTVTPELRAEGLAREMISRVQRLRKEARLEVSDRIVLAWRVTKS
jgi:isoleucyl-tRNA synthetase